LPNIGAALEKQLLNAGITAGWHYLDSVTKELLKEFYHKYKENK
jgi:hypothetical protein